jgi:glucose-1-phosphate thymidylyltransferase
LRVVILAAGYGTRLYPLIVDTPKSLLKIADRTLMDYLLDRLAGVSDIQEVLVVTNSKFYSHFSEWAGGRKGISFPIRVLNDGTKTPDDRRGSIGDIQFAIEESPIREDLLILGGDNLFDYSLAPGVEFARKKRPHATVGLYDIGSTKDARQFGVVALGPDRRVTSFEEKPAQPKSSLVAMCFYFLPKETIGFVQDYLRETGKKDKAGEYIRWLAEKKGAYGFQFQGRWYDLGSIEAYEEAQRDFSSKKG